MITKTKAYTSSDGTVHATLEAAQRCELLTLFPESNSSETAWNPTVIVNTLFANADRIRDVLTTRPTSRPRARAVNGNVKLKRADAGAVKKGLKSVRDAADSTSA